MFGLRIARMNGEGMGAALPDGSLALFRASKRVKRSDVVLVDHPELGPLVRKVSAIAMNGTVALRGLARDSFSSRQMGNVDPEFVYGKMMLRMRWFRVFPRFGRTSEQTSATSDDNTALL